LARLLCGAGIVAGAGGCADPASLALSGASAISFAETGRTLTDHAMSAATDQDCSLLNSLSGEAWCQPVEKAQPHASWNGSVHCYRSIAEVTCYRQENPWDTASRRTPAPPQ
jgi:hypothetical protein